MKHIISFDDMLLFAIRENTWYTKIGDAMEMLKITINDKQYEYIDSIVYKDKCYVALGDEESITISEYSIVKGKVEFVALDDTLFKEVKEAMNL